MQSTRRVNNINFLLTIEYIVKIKVMRIMTNYSLFIIIIIIIIIKNNHVRENTLILHQILSTTGYRSFANSTY